MEVAPIEPRRFPLQRATLLVAATFGALLLSPPSSGADEGAAAFNGRWTNVAGDGGRRAIERGIERGIEDMFALARPTARSRLGESNPPIQRVELEITGTSIRYDIGSGRSGSQAQGGWHRGRTATGDAIQVRFTLMASGVLKMETRTDGGSARHVFRLSDDGSQLSHDVRIHSSHLPDDVRYTLTYRRAR